MKDGIEADVQTDRIRVKRSFSNYSARDQILTESTFGISKVNFPLTFKFWMLDDLWLESLYLWVLTLSSLRKPVHENNLPNVHSFVFIARCHR